MSKKLISIPQSFEEYKELTFMGVDAITIDIETASLNPKESKVFASMDPVKGDNLHTYILFYQANPRRRTAPCLQESQGMILKPHLISKEPSYERRGQNSPLQSQPMSRDDIRSSTWKVKYGQL